MLASTAGLAALSCWGSRGPTNQTWAAPADAEGWVTLFDGKTLEGWHKNPEKIGHGTGGHWTVEPGGALAGEQDPPGSGNGGILLTDPKFGEFELSIELKPAWGGDSGVFVRCTDQGQCYQMLVDYYDGGNVGHFYGEGTGGWGARAFSLQGEVRDGQLMSLATIEPQSPNDVGLDQSCTGEEWLKAWKIDDWNAALIRVEGGALPKITTHINDLQVGVLDLSKFKAPNFNADQIARTLGDEGSIAVQVHGGGSYPAGRKTRFRNIRIRPL
jgi:hypothetical protein